MSGSGLNHNMNAHVGNRISSRVLQPPGGASSFSFGSEPAPRRAAPVRHQTKENYSNFKNQFNDCLSSSDSDKNRNGDRMKDSLDNAMNSRRSNERKSSYPVDNMQAADNRQMSDSRRGSVEQYNQNRGNVVQQYPNHDEDYSGSRRSVQPRNDDDFQRRNNAPTTMRNDDYAEMLRQQIEDKKNYNSSAKIGSHVQNSNNNSREGSRHSTYREAEQSVSQRKSHNSGGGKSSINLSWE